MTNEKTISWERFCQLCESNYLVDVAKSCGKGYFYNPIVKEENGDLIVELENFNIFLSRKKNKNIVVQGYSVEITSDDNDTFYFQFLSTLTNNQILES